MNNFIQSVAIAPSNGAIIYAGTDAGTIFRAIAGNSGSDSTWTNISTGLPAAPVTAISVNATDPNTVYATFGNFGVGHVWKTTNGGTSWTNITGTLPDIPTTSIVTYPSFTFPAVPSTVLIVGTDIGIYVSTDTGTTWQTLASGLPNVGIQQLFMDQAQTTLFAATHGRGVWKIGIPTALLHSIAITPISPTITAGSTRQFTATGTFADNTTQDITSSVTWAATGSAATISNTAGSNGLATGISIGTSTITATRDGVTSNSATLTVTFGVASISPSSGSTAGGTVPPLPVGLPPERL